MATPLTFHFGNRGLARWPVPQLLEEVLLLQRRHQYLNEVHDAYPATPLRRSLYWVSDLGVIELVPLASTLVRRKGPIFRNGRFLSRRCRGKSRFGTGGCRRRAVDMNYVAIVVEFGVRSVPSANGCDTRLQIEAKLVCE